jgi:hypothetical protein
MTEASHAADYRTHQVSMGALAATAFFASAPGQSFLIAVFVDDMLDGTDLTRTAFSGLYATGTVVSAVAMLALDRVIDRHGLRLAWGVVTVALAMACRTGQSRHWGDPRLFGIGADLPLRPPVAG